MKMKMNRKEINRKDISKFRNSSDLETFFFVKIQINLNRIKKSASAGAFEVVR